MNSFTWDGTVDGIINMAVWWNKNLEVVDRYSGVTVDELLDKGFTRCFEEPEYKHEPNANLYGKGVDVYFTFTKGRRTGLSYKMFPGDTVFYDGEGKFSYLESCECVVISQDWP